MNFQGATRLAASSAPVENGAFGSKAAAPGAARRALGDIVNGGVKPQAAPKLSAHAFAGPSADIEQEMDIDSADAGDPSAVSEYVADIYAHYRVEELTKSAKHGYMAVQTDINEKMRAILIDWLVEVHLKFKLMPETLYLTVNIIDRFLERKLVVRQKLQLVGVTAMLLASKYEEIYAPEVRDFVYITDKAYTKEQILAMEAQMLNNLDFRITAPTPYVFLNRYLKVCGETDAAAKVNLLSTYLVERALQEYKMLAYAPSKLAAAGVNMAMRTVRGPAAWDVKMERFSGYKQSELLDAVRDIQAVLEAQPANNLKAVSRKYSLPKFSEVALLPIAQLA